MNGIISLGLPGSIPQIVTSGLLGGVPAGHELTVSIGRAGLLNSLYEVDATGVYGLGYVIALHEVDAVISVYDLECSLTPREIETAGVYGLRCLTAQHETDTIGRYDLTNLTGQQEADRVSGYGADTVNSIKEVDDGR